MAEQETGIPGNGIEGDPLRLHALRYASIAEKFERSVEDFGLPFEEGESCPRSCREELCAQDGIIGENNCFSLRRGWISPSCVACRKGLRSATFFISLKCHRSCYFCFNPNQEDYEYHLHHKRDIAREIQEAHACGMPLEHIAITGGEPLLFFDELERFTSVARDLYPHARIRLYTCGDQLDAGKIARLAEAGLDEMRFSVKLDDDFSHLDKLIARFDEARSRGIDVMVEMPVEPFMVNQMKELLLRLDEAGVRGINLLELCFPFWNAEEFVKRGLCLRKEPYDALYDYWYGGGLPIAGSEAACLELLSYAAERNLKMGVHYCSADNKNTGQLFQQNYPHRDRFAFCSFTEEGFYLTSVKVFEPAATEIREHFRQNGVKGFRAVSDGSYVELKPELVSELPERLLSHQALRCLHVVEPSGAEVTLREIKVEAVALHDLAVVESQMSTPR